MNPPVTAWVAPGDIQPVDEHGEDAVRYKRGDLVDRLLEHGIFMAAELRDYADGLRLADHITADSVEQLADDFDALASILDGAEGAEQELWPLWP